MVKSDARYLCGFDYRTTADGRRVDGGGVLLQSVLLADRWRRYIPFQDRQVTAILSSAAQTDLGDDTSL